MTEQQWLKSINLLPMLQMPQITPRQRRLFAAACCRHVQNLSTNKQDIDVFNVIDVIEKYADDKVSINELDFYRQLLISPVSDNISDFIAIAVYHAACVEESTSSDSAEYAAIYSQYINRSSVNYERQWQLDALRHITGNPFQPKPVINVPNNTKQLAHALYEGRNCYFALYDALIDAGYPDLADHFKDEYHPKGCWLLDLLRTS